MPNMHFTFFLKILKDLDAQHSEHSPVDSSEHRFRVILQKREECDYSNDSIVEIIERFGPRSDKFEFQVIPPSDSHPEKVINFRIPSQRHPDGPRGYLCDHLRSYEAYLNRERSSLPLISTEHLTDEEIELMLQNGWERPQY